MHTRGRSRLQSKAKGSGPALAPRQLGVGTSQVECHLFDDDALEEARRRALERERTPV
jgi:hypothetical protein